MKKQKLFSILSLLGTIYLIWLAISFFQHRNIEPVTVTSVPEAFERQFSNVTTKKRLQKIVEAEFLDQNGVETSFRNFEGKYLLVNFWATWCAPCVIELPSLGRLKDKLDADQIEIIAISLDMQRSQDDIRTFLANRNIGQFAAFLDYNKDIQGKIRMRGIPTSFLLNPRGEITHIFEGDANWASPSSVAFFNDVLFGK